MDVKVRRKDDRLTVTRTDGYYEVYPIISNLPEEGKYWEEFDFNVKKIKCLDNYTDEEHRFETHYGEEYHEFPDGCYHLYEMSGDDESIQGAVEYTPEEYAEAYLAFAIDYLQANSFGIDDIKHWISVIKTYDFKKGIDSMNDYILKCEEFDDAVTSEIERLETKTGGKSPGSDLHFKTTTDCVFVDDGHTFVGFAPADAYDRNDLILALAETDMNEVLSWDNYNIEAVTDTWNDDKTFKFTYDNTGKYWILKDDEREVKLPVGGHEHTADYENPVTTEYFLLRDEKSTDEAVRHWKKQSEKEEE